MNSSFDLTCMRPGPPSQGKSLCTWNFTVALALAVLAWLYVRFFMTEGAAPTDHSQCLAEDDVEGKILSVLISVCSCVSNDYSSDSFFDVSEHCVRATAARCYNRHPAAHTRTGI